MWKYIWTINQCRWRTKTLLYIQCIAVLHLVPTSQARDWCECWRLMPSWHHLSSAWQRQRTHDSPPPAANHQNVLLNNYLQTDKCNNAPCHCSIVKRTQDVPCSVRGYWTGRQNMERMSVSREWTERHGRNKLPDVLVTRKAKITMKHVY